MMRIALFLFSVTLLSGGEIPDFRREVQPIFEKYCVSCHGGGARMGGFQYAIYDNVMRLVVPGRSHESRLYLMLTAKAEPAMPLDKRSLSKEELGVIRRWINAGARRPSLFIKPPKQDPKLIYSMALSPDGKSFALGRFSYIDYIVPGTQLSGLLASGSDTEVRALDFSRDGRLLASGGGELRIWDLALHKPVVTVRESAIVAVVFAPDSRTVATGGEDQLIKVREVSTGRLLRTLSGHTGAIEALRFTPDGKRLVSGAADGTLRVWDPGTGAQVYTMSQGGGGVNALAVSPDGTRVAGGGKGKWIRIWRMGEQLAGSTIEQEDEVLRLAWSPDGTRLASASADQVVKMYRVSDWSRTVAWPEQSDQVFGLEFTVDGRALAIARRDGSFERRSIEPAPSVYSRREHEIRDQHTTLDSRF